MDWKPGYPILFLPDGDRVYQAIWKLIQENGKVYAHLNMLRGNVEGGVVLHIDGVAEAEALLPPVASTGKIWVTKDTGHFYVWNGLQFDDIRSLTLNFANAEIPGIVWLGTIEGVNGLSPSDKRVVTEEVLAAKSAELKDVYLATGLKVLAAYDNTPIFDLDGPLAAVSGKIAVGDKLKINDKIARITRISEQEEVPEGDVPKVYVTLDKAVLSAADTGAEIARGVAMVGIPDGVPVGKFDWYCGQTPPKGYLVCDGSAIPRAVYPELYAVIGTTFGAGDGATTFNLPNLQDDFIRGGGTRTRPIGTREGDGQRRQTALRSRSSFSIPSQNKTIEINGSTATISSDYWDYAQVTGIKTNTRGGQAAGNFTIVIDDLSRDRLTNEVYSWITSESRPRNIALLPCIKY